MRVEVVLALVMLFAFFALDWFEAGPLLSIKGYNVVSTISRLRSAFNQSASTDSSLYIYYGLYAIPVTCVIGMLLSYNDRRQEAFSTISSGGVVAILILAIQASGNNFELVEAFGPGAWLAIAATVASFFLAADHRKKAAAEKAREAESKQKTEKKTDEWGL